MKASEHAERARSERMQGAHACGIDDAFISQLVESFYAAVRQDDVLGPIFTKHGVDWSAHLARMKDFWASVMIETGRYSGNPMQKHIAVGGLDAAHFARWHRLWNQALIEAAPNSAAADRFRDAAQRIGESLLTGIEIERGGLSSLSARAAGSSERSLQTQSQTKQGH